MRFKQLGSKLTCGQAGRIIGVYLLCLLVSTYLFAGIIIIFPQSEEFLSYLASILAHGWFGCIIICVVLSTNDRNRRKQSKKELKEEKRKQQAEQYVKAVEAELRQKERMKKIQEEVQKQIIRDNTPIQATYVLSRPQKDTYADLFGFGKPRYQITTGYQAVFRIKYASGRIDVETVDVDSARFKQLAILPPLVNNTK